jgi:hypothetical protein
MTKRGVSEWIDGPEIKRVTIASYSGMANDWQYAIGCEGVTKIERAFKSGMHSDIPYVRIWKGDTPHAEFCQHHIVGVEFIEPPNQKAQE